MARMTNVERRNIGRLYLLSGYSIRQIAKKVGRSIPTVRNTLHRQRIKPDRKRDYPGPQMADGSYGKVGQ